MRTGIEVEEARRRVLEGAEALPAEVVATADALGRVLAAPVASARTLPPADCSAMDGYALRAGDLAGASRGSPRRLAIAFEVPAGGSAPRTLRPGEAARIFTGAPLPPGADSVVMQEDVLAEGAEAAFRAAPARGEHVRAAGEDVRAGDEVLAGRDAPRRRAARGAGLARAERGARPPAAARRDPVGRRRARRARRGRRRRAHRLVERVLAGRAVREAGALATNLGIARDTHGRPRARASRPGSPPTCW